VSEAKKKAREKLENDPELLLMMSIAEKKNCWLKDLDDIPYSELILWLAYYDIQNKYLKEHQKKAEREQKQRSKTRGMR